MISTMTQRQLDKLIQWAESHDWGKDAVIRCNSIVLPHADGGLISFTSKQQLIQWAGY